MSLAGRVTVSVLTHDRAAELSRTLERLIPAAEDAPILVVDNGSTDATPEVLARFSPRVTAIRLDENHGAAGRNTGVLAAQTPHVALADDDTWWAPGALATASRALDEHPDVAILTARVLVGDSGALDPTCVEMQNSPLAGRADLPGPPILGFLAGASMVRRSAFLAAGGFDPRFFLGGEERLLAVDLARAGWSMAYLPEAVVHHHPSPSRDPEARRALLARNALWFAWLRRPVPSALRTTAALLSRAARERPVRRGVLRATLGLPWIVRERREIPPEIERALRLLHV